MEEFIVNFAQLNIKILCVSPKIKIFCKDFLVENTRKTDLVISSSEKNVKELFKKGEGSLPYCEVLDIFRKIAEKLPLFNRCVFHGATIKYKDECIVFCAESGVGKTTHILLWQKNLKGVEIINGDKPILWVKSDGVYACGNPWRGKEGLGGKNIQKVTAFCFLERFSENKIEKITCQKAIELFLKQVYIPQKEITMQKTFDFLEEFLKIPTYLLKCNMEKGAFATAFNTLINGEKI